ncbi:acidic leucine-rich nuclear phosphoprotein 32 family member B-like [Gossypium australe]|uniref:Acidic leucine-rich nuclear phosphoprotein 32 family member B-like n=1 Tax=Gossypium australe TaxID=47621 RepID=A0A5B6V1E9_9ROSI|nr:acidic leucine-rich nuclear phosphoprotein 32 family member B-like [Gossypium australe]
MRTDVKQVQFECTNSTRTLTKLEDQISQLISMIGDIKRQIGTVIPRNTKDNPWREETEPESEEVITPATETEKEVTKDSAGTKIPFPSILEEKQRRDEDEFVSFLNMFITLKVNLPLIELIEKAPKYANFSKEILARRKKLKVPQKLKDPGSFTIPIEDRKYSSSIRSSS